jgi:hypothetical protein
MLSILANAWYIADLNYSVEDRQIFLDTILAAKDKLYLSYIGRDENNNTVIEPSTVLRLFKDILLKSIANSSAHIKQIEEVYALHPFYNNTQQNYSSFWGSLSGSIYDNVEDARWNFAQNLSLVVKPEQLQAFATISIQRILATLLYSNSNLYMLLNLTEPMPQAELPDYEDLEILSKPLARRLLREFNSLPSYELLKLHESGALLTYMQAKGLLTLAYAGVEQLDTYFNAYLAYLTLKAQPHYKFSYTDSELGIQLNDEVIVDGESLIILPEFTEIREGEFEIAYKPKHRSLALIYLAIVNNPDVVWYDKSNQPVPRPNIFKVKLYILQDATLEALPVNNIRWLLREFEASFIADFAASNPLKRLLRFYHYSLTHPVLVHLSAVEKYLATIKDEPQNEFLEAKAYNMMMATLYSQFNNYGLEKLQSDRIWSAIINDYPTIIKKYKLYDTLAVVASFLSYVKLAEK